MNRTDFMAKELADSNEPGNFRRSHEGITYYVYFILNGWINGTEDGGRPYGDTNQYDGWYYILDGEPDGEGPYETFMYACIKGDEAAAANKDIIAARNELNEFLEAFKKKYGDEVTFALADYAIEMME